MKTTFSLKYFVNNCRLANSNMQNLMMVLTFSALDGKHLFGQIRSKKIKIVSLS